MSDLAGCYFCGETDGTASLRLGGSVTATLCPDCRTKLEHVLETVESAPAAPGESPDDSDSDINASATSSRPSTTAASGNAEQPSTTQRSRPSAEANEDTEADASEPAADSGETTISALEHNKVMRLLENREFPVDRSEFVAVAANAYRVDHADCDRVIDAAIEEGLIAEADGRLVRPD